MSKQLGSIIAGLVLAAWGATAEEPKTTAAPASTNLPAVTPAVSVATNTAPVPPVALATNGASHATHAPADLVPAAPTPDPMVGKVLLALATHLQSASRFRCEVSFLINSEMEGMKQEISATYALAAEKPNRLALRFVKGMAGNTVVCNGSNLVTYAPSLNRYQESEAPKTFEQFSQGVGPLSGNMLFVDNLLRDDIYAAIMDGVIKAVYVGREMVDGVECDHVKFVQEQFDWEMWLTVGVKPVVVQVLNDMSKGLGAMTGEGSAPKGMRMTVLNRFAGWVVDGTLPPEVFEFKPPAGAHKADSLFEGDEEEPVGRPVNGMPDDGTATNKLESKDNK